MVLILQYETYGTGLSFRSQTPLITDYILTPAPLRVVACKAQQHLSSTGQQHPPEVSLHLMQLSSAQLKRAASTF